MKKGFKYYAVVWAILFAIFNLVCFVTPNEVEGMSKFGGAFWAGYVGITLAFIGQIVCAYFAFQASSKEKFFLNIPLIRISYITLVLTVIFGAICMLIPNLPNWFGIIICFAILALGAISVIKAKAAAEVVEAVGEKVKAKTAFIKTLIVDAESLIASAKTDEIKADCKKVYEALRYSDPVSSEALFEIEREIESKLALLKQAVKDNNASAVSEYANEIVVLADNRNKKCRMMK